jgi:hypothetical protein
MTFYNDYRFKFPLASLGTALQALAALRAANIIMDGNLPANMLGDPRDNSGNNVTADDNTLTFFGRTGQPAITYIDPDTQQQITQPAIGDPNYWYVAIRSTTTPSEIPFDPTVYGLIPCDPDESAAVLGVWASKDWFIK